MRTVILIFCAMICFYSNVKAQRMPSDLYQEGNGYYSDRKLDDALYMYKYVEANYKRSEFYVYSLNKIGSIYYEQGDLNSAIKILTRVIYDDFSKIENPLGVQPKNFDGSKRIAAELLSRIYEKEKVFDSALIYFDISESKKRIVCSSGLDNVLTSNALKRAGLLKKIGKETSAIKTLLKSFKDVGLNRIEIINMLKVLLKDNYELKLLLDEALSKAYSRSYFLNQKVRRYYYIKFQGVEIELPREYGLDKIHYGQDMANQNFKESLFYKTLTGEK